MTFHNLSLQVARLPVAAATSGSHCQIEVLWTLRVLYNIADDYFDTFNQIYILKPKCPPPPYKTPTVGG